MATFTAKPIDALPAATKLQDDDMIPICQDGTARQLNGAAFRDFAATVGAEQAKTTLDKMSVDIITLESGSSATAEKGTDDAGNIKLILGIPGSPATPQSPVKVADDGYTDIQGLRQMVNFTAVKAGNVINVTSTLQGNKVHTDVITLDDNGYPTTILSDGVTTVFSFQGFDL